VEKRTSGAKRIPRGKTSVLPSVAAAKALIAVASYGTAKSRALRSVTFSAGCKAQRFWLFVRTA
jgi:hypothetical protein